MLLSNASKACAWHTVAIPTPKPAKLRNLSWWSVIANAHSPVAKRGRPNSSPHYTETVDSFDDSLWYTLSVKVPKPEIRDRKRFIFYWTRFLYVMVINCPSNMNSFHATLAIKPCAIRNVRILISYCGQPAWLLSWPTCKWQQLTNRIQYSYVTS